MNRIFLMLLSVLISAGLFAQTLDTLSYPLDNASSFSIYGYTGGGYLAGTNIDGTDIGQTFTASGGDLTSVIIGVGAINIIGSADQFELNVYNVSNGLPTGAPIGSLQFNTSDLDTGSTVASSLNTLTFSSPVPVTGDFAITFDFDLSTRDDSIGLISNADGDGNGLGRSIARFNGQWFTVLNAYNGLDLDFLIMPILQNSSSLSLDINQVRCGEYTSYPESQIQPITFGGTVENNGSVNVDLISGSVTVTEVNSGIQVYNQSLSNLNLLVPSISAGATQTVDIPSNFASYTPTDTGVYRVDVELEYGEAPYSSGAPTQLASGNYFFVVDDSLYARDEFLIFGQNFDAVGVGIPNGLGLGQAFDVATADTITSVDLIYSNDTSVNIGTDIQVNIYNFTANGPGTLLGSTNTYTIPDDSARAINLQVQNGPLVLTPGEYFIEANNVPRGGYSEQVFTSGKAFVELGSGWGLLDTVAQGAFAGSFMIRPNFGSEPSSQQPPTGTCDTLVNVNVGVDTLTIYGIQGGGLLSGHSADGIERFAEKFTSPYANSEINEISFAFGVAQTNNPGSATITATIWEDDGANSFFGGFPSPGTQVASQSILISNIATDVSNNDLTTVTFANPPVVSGDFFVGYEITYAAGDTVALITNQDESVPSTFFMDLTPLGANAWARADSLYTTDISGLILADICETTTSPAPVANFEADRITVFEGSDIQFTDLSTNNPTSWDWAFQGGSPATSTQQNPLVTYNTAGVYDVSLDVSNTGGSDAITATDFITVLTLPQLPACDTLPNIDTENDFIFTAAANGGGYIAGHNSFGDLAKADKFTGLNAGDEITGALLGFSVAQFGSPSSTVDINVWDDTGANGTPGSVIATETITIQSIANDVSNNILTYVNFSSPVTVSAGADYYIGVGLTYGPGDTVALYHNEDGEAAPEVAWEQFSNGDWFAYSDAQNSWGIEVSNLIAPLVCSACPTIGTTVSTTNASCGSSDGSATVSVLGGAAPYTYSWDDPGSQITATASNLASGTYTVTVTDDNGCTATATANVSDSGSPSVSLDAKGDVSCNGGSDGFISVIVTGGTPPYTYSWDNGGASATITNLLAGTYSLTVEDANGCSEVFSETISQPTALSVSVTSVTDLSCASVNDGEVVVTPNGGTLPLTYNWSSSANTDSIEVNLSDGPVSVTVTDANGCTASVSATVDPPANPLSVTVNNAQTSACGATDASLTATATGGAGGNTYSWTGSASTTMTASNLGAGSYAVTVEDASGCTATTTATVSDPGSLSVSVSTTNVTCNGSSDGTATAQVTGGSGSESYSWDVGGSTATINGQGPGQVTVTVSDAGCTAVASGTITEPTAISISFTQTNVTCNGGNNGAASASVSGGTSPYNYNWVGQNNTSSTISSLEADSYILNVTDDNGCSNSEILVITQPLDISASIDADSVSCYGGGNGTAQVIVSGGGTPPYSYNWDVGGSSSLLNGLTAGTYEVTVSDINNCEKILTANVGQPDSISITLDNINDVTCNNLADGSISLNVTGGNDTLFYAWSDPQSQTTQTATNLEEGNYFVTVTDNKGCTKVSSNSFVVDEPAPLTLSEDFVNVSCAGGSDGFASVAVSGGTTPYSYTWSSPITNTDSIVLNLSAGLYEVTVTDDNGCTNSVNFNIQDGTTPTVATSVTDASGTANNGTATANVTGGQAPYTYEWDDADAQTTATATGLDAGTYNVTVTDANGCDATATATVARDVSVGELAKSVNLRLFPNPTSGNVTLQLDLQTASEVQVEWVNVIGAQVYAEDLGTTLNVNRSFDLGQYAAGIYFAKIRIDDNMIIKKVIVSKQ